MGVGVLQHGAAVRREGPSAWRATFPALEVRGVEVPRLHLPGVPWRGTRPAPAGRRWRPKRGQHVLLDGRKQSGANSLASIAVSLVSQDSFCVTAAASKRPTMRCCCLLNADAWASYAAAERGVRRAHEDHLHGGPLAGNEAVNSAGRPGAQPAPPRTVSAAALSAAPGASSPRRLIPRCIPCIMS